MNGFYLIAVLINHSVLLQQLMSQPGSHSFPDAGQTKKFIFKLPFLAATFAGEINMERERLSRTMGYGRKQEGWVDSVKVPSCGLFPELHQSKSVFSIPTAVHVCIGFPITNKKKGFPDITCCVQTSGGLNFPSQWGRKGATSHSPWEILLQSKRITPVWGSTYLQNKS